MGLSRLPARLVPPAHLGALLVLVVAALAVHGRALGFPFVLDDRLAIAGNEYLKSQNNPFSFFVSDYSRSAELGPG